MVNNTQKNKEREFILECINLYRKLPTLWNIKSKEYHDRDKKNAAYELLLSKYKEMFPEATKDDVKKKINSLRTNYRKELKKHLQSMKSGSVYQPTLWYYEEMFFLQDQESDQDSDAQSSMDIQFTILSVESDTKHSTTQDSTTTGDCETSSKANAVPGPKPKKLKKENEDDLELPTISHRQKPDEYENWALACAADLKNMEPLQQIFAKKAIADIIMEGQLGLLHRNSVKINTRTCQHANTSRQPQHSTVPRHRRGI